MKKKTIHEAVTAVLTKSRGAMTAQEIYEAIVRDNLYEFRAKDPLNVVRNQIRRHSINVKGAATSRTKYFRRVEGERFELLGIAIIEK